jgi:hypothetical protein
MLAQVTLDLHMLLVTGITGWAAIQMGSDFLAHFEWQRALYVPHHLRLHLLTR